MDKLFLKINVIIILFLIYIYFLILIKKKNKTINDKYKYNDELSKKIFLNNSIEILTNQNIFQNEQSYSNFISKEKNESIQKGKKFFEICMNNKLINNKTFSRYLNPFISVVTPVYNAKEHIFSLLRSIQNQNISNLEIIFVNDASDNLTYNILIQSSIEDPRILLIHNKKNMGTLYSRCIGTIKSKGKYIFPLDHDDLFFDEGVLDIISTIADKGNFDIVEFKGAERYSINLMPFLRILEIQNSVFIKII